MTSRLKHKLDLEQINLKSAYLNESFVQIGTPLPALAESKKDKLEYVPEWQQEVRDEQGRRRFHGAFTGGYSAGYYNSVGSKEGWAPTTFKSSRTNRANKVQRPEDFMDEEDLAQMKEDRTLENTETFRSDRIGSTSAELADRGIPSALQSLIEPARSSIGQTLLQKQGWRPGQGIGPRVTLRRLKLHDVKAGRSSEGMMEVDEEGDDHSGKHLFAPRDTKLVTYEQKEEKQGLGYVRGMGKGLERAKPLNIRANHVDMADEDDDPYSVAGPSTSARPFAFTDEDEDMPVVIGGSSTAPRYTPTTQSSRSDIDTGRWHDGRPVLNGFELDPLGVPADKWFEMPDIPPDWRPRPARVWGSVKKWDERPEDVKVTKEVMRGIPGRPLTFEQRGQALGEVIPTPATPQPATAAAEESKTSKAKSVFEYMSEKDRERIQAIAALARAGKTLPPPPLSLSDPTDEAPPQPSRPTSIVIPPLSPRTAGAALRGFAPYGDDHAKQDRYRSYLSSQTLHTKTPHPTLKTGSIDEINKELEDFAGSARIFRPMSYAMSSRFTSGSASLAGSDMKQAKAGLHMYDAAKAAEAIEAAKKAGKAKDVEDENRSMTPRERAAREGRYGVETRIVKEFYPVKLVCRRFGVQDPHPEGDPMAGKPAAAGGGSGGDGELGVGGLPKNDASWEDSFIHQPSTSTSTDPTAPSSASVMEEGGERVPKSLAEVGMADDVNQGRDTLTYTKPSIDIFKAIFASDDEDSDEEDGEEEQEEAAKVVVPPSRSMAPTRGAKQGPVDLGTFKPVFQVKREREDGDGAVKGMGPAVVGLGEGTNCEGGAVAGAKKKRKKEKKAPRGSLSFLVDEEEDGQGGGDNKGSGQARKMERKENGPTRPVKVVSAPEPAMEVKLDVEDFEQDEWVEKAVPVIAPSAVLGTVGRGGVGLGRKGAADFM